MNRKVIILSLILLSMSSAADDSSDTPTLDKLKVKHDLGNPERNFRELEDLEIKTDSRDGDNRTEKLLNRFFESDLQRDKELDLSHFQKNINQQQLQNDASSWALSSSSTVGMPALNDNGNIKLEYSEEGTLKHVRNSNGQYEFAVSDGGARRTSGLGQEDIFTQEINNDEHTRFDDVKDAYGDEQALFSSGSHNITQLKNKQSLTSDAVAYRTILGSQERALDTQISEDFLDGTVDFLDNHQRDPSDFFTECRTTTTNKKIESTGSLYNDYLCQEVNRNNYDFCEIRRDVAEQGYIRGQEFSKCGDSCFEFNLKMEEQSSSSMCSTSTGSDIVSVGSLVYLMNDDVSISKIEVKYHTADQFMLELNETPLLFNHNKSVFRRGEHSGIHSYQDWYNHIPSIGSIKLCNISGHNHVSESWIDITEIALNILNETNDDPQHQSMKFEPHIAWGGAGHGDFNIKVHFTGPMDEVEEHITQYPEGCFDKASYASEVAKANISACSFTGYEVIDEGPKNLPPIILNQLGPLFPGDTGNATWRVNLEGYACEPFSGEDICLTPYDEEGEICKSWYGWFGQHTDTSNDLIIANQCSKFKSDPSCELIESECEDGMLDGDICRISSNSYECAEGIGGSREVTFETNTCDAMIPCAGGECDNTNSEVNDDFVKAASQASILHELSNDSTCVDENGNAENCEIFSGSYGTCARAVGLAGATKLGGPDCCDDPTAVGVQEYILAARQVAQFEAVQKTATWAATPIKGGYDKIASGVGSAWDKVTSSFTSASETVAGNATGAGAGSTGNMMTDGIGVIKDATMQWMADNLPQGVTHAIFATTTEGVGEEAVTRLVDPPEFSEGMQTVGNFAQGFMTAYSYYTMAKLAMDIAFQCEEDETEVAGAKSQLQCVYLEKGTCKLDLVVTGCVRRNFRYCCFNSILARIIMEQAAEQLDRPLGTGEACRGLTLTELSQLNWDLIDLESEWIPLMFESGYIVADTDEATLTGDGRTINQGAREVVSERTKSRFNNLSDDDLRDIDQELRTSLDCSKYPRPLVCNY